MVNRLPRRRWCSSRLPAKSNACRWREPGRSVFGVSLLEVAEDGVYRVEYSGKQTGDFKIGVFDFPALTRADAELRYPDYTGFTNKTIRDTHRISAVEGTKLNYTLQLNKPVVSARLINTEQSLSLALQTNAIAALNGFMLTNSSRYALELVDADGRTNKPSAEFVIQVLPNRPPEIKIAFPSGDQRVSSLEEMQLQGEARDDFGLLKYGLGFGVAGQSHSCLSWDRLRQPTRSASSPTRSRWKNWAWRWINWCPTLRGQRITGRMDRCDAPSAIYSSPRFARLKRFSAGSIRNSRE